MLIRTKKGTLKEVIYSEQQLYNYGINRVSEREWARKELQTKMQRLQPDLVIVNRVLDKLETQGYLSDARRAKSIFNQFSSRESIHKTKQRIAMKGVHKDTIQAIIDENSEFLDETDNALALLSKKFKAYDPELRDKMTRHLASKGFKYDTISKAIGLFKELIE